MTARRSYPEANADADPIYEQAVAYMVEQIGIALPKAKIVFVIDADRRAIVAGKSTPGHWHKHTHSEGMSSLWLPRA